MSSNKFMNESRDHVLVRLTVVGFENLIFHFDSFFRYKILFLGNDCRS